MAKTPTFDAIVVGSGATGGWAAKQLTEKGLRVLLLEAGKMLDPEKDYRMLQWPYELKYRGLLPQEQLLKTRQPIQSKCYACTEYANHLFVDDVDTRTPRRAANPLIGFADATSAGARSCGAASRTG
jgi:choline dehydrogenase-like flavoprotein